MGKFFSCIFSHSEPNANLLKKQEVILEELKHKKTTLSQLNSLDKPFSEEEVKQSIKRLKNKKKQLGLIE